MMTRNDLTSKPDPRPLRHLPNLAKLSVLAGALLCLGTCNQGSDGSTKAPAPQASPAPNASPAPQASPAPAKHVLFNGGYNNSTDALGRKTGAPNFLKGHSWITKKAMDYLTARGLLPPVLQPDRNKNYLYYGTTYADWIWMGRPEAPDDPVWSPVVKALDAVDDLCHGTPPSSPSCPYNDNCTTAAVQSLCRSGLRNTDPCTSSPALPADCALCSPNPESPFLNRIAYTCKSLAANLGRVAAADCTDPSPNGLGLCPSPTMNWPNSKTTPQATTAGYGARSGFDHTYKCLLGSDSALSAHKPCMNLATARYRKEDVDFAYDIIGVNLNLNATAILGLGNSYQSASLLQLDGSAEWFNPSEAMVIQLVETNLPLHANPAMLFRIDLNLGGDGGWIGDWFTSGPQWNDPTIQDSALDNLYHYALSDITRYDSSLFSAQWGQPHDPISTDPGIQACNGIVGSLGDKYNYITHSRYEWCLEDLSPYGTSVLAFPFRADDFALIGNDYPNLKQEAFYQMNMQPVYGRAEYGAPTYGSILYQFARKFFKGSPSQPTAADMIKAGRGTGLLTGGSYGTQSIIGGANFDTIQLDFPHTYLGGNPFICSGGRTSDDSIDSCASGDRTWPIWVPDDYDPTKRDEFLDKLKATNPGPSNRAALIYLGWASHLMQDLALPHHASNWSGLRHAAQDSYGDMYAVAEAIVTNRNTPFSFGPNDPLVAFNTVNINDDNLAWMTVALGGFEDEMKNLVTQMIGHSESVNWTGSDIDAFCNTNGLPRGAISDGSIKWDAVKTAFLQQGQTAFASRQMGTDDQCSPYLVGYPYPKGIVQNAILATMKLILCAAPYDAQPIAAPEQVRAVPVDKGVDVVWEPVAGATGYVVYIATSGSSDYTMLGEVTDPHLPATRDLTNGTNYTVYVVAEDANGVEGQRSAVVGVTPNLATCANAPQLWVEREPDAVVLYWTPMRATALKYHVFMTNGDDHIIIDLGYSYEPTFTNSVGRYDSPYFWVQAENSDCKTPTSNIVTAPWGGSNLSAPANFAVTPVDHGADLYWDQVGGAAGYVVFVAPGGSTVFTELGTANGQDTTGYWVSGLKNGSSYSFFVAATSAFGLLSAPSDTISTAAGSGPQPEATQLWAQPGDGQVTLQWVGVPSAAYYNLRMKTDPNADYTKIACWTRKTTCTVTELANGTTYYFVVEGANSDYPSGNPQSNTVTVSPNMTVLPYPEGVRATPAGPKGAGNGYIDLTWDPVPGAAKYILYRDHSTSGPSDYELVDIIDPVPANQVNFYSLRGMVYGTSYNFAVAALDGNWVEGTRRWPVSVTAGESPDLVAPNVTAEAGDGQVTLSWTSVPGASIYRVWMKTDASADFTRYDVWQTWTLSTADTSAVLNNLSNGVTYYFWVHAGNSASLWNEVPISTVVSATPQLPCPGGPTCSGHGTCNAGVCSCTPGSGYSGPDCSVTCPNGPTCSSHGTCNAGVCTCTPGSGYSGPDCSVTCPNGPTCSGHGTCNAGVCTCTPGSGYSGPDCSVTCPGGPTCSSHGTCNAGVCSCTPGSGYSGADCSVTCPNGPTCSGHGTCTNGVCGCQSGYSGADCSVTCPGGPSCSGHGTCNAGVCKCAVGYSGTSCSVNCGSSSTCPDGTGCTNNNQCATRSCVNGLCKPLACAPNCTQGTACGASGDCGSRVCTNGTCRAPSCSPNCNLGNACGVNADCGSRICSSTSSTCQSPSCTPHCNQGTYCDSNSDCGSALCASHLCQPPTCTPLCAPGAHCGTNADCASKVCTNNLCAAPSCSPRCAQGASCGVSGDCLSRVCTSGTCRVPACSPTCAKGAACGTNTDCKSKVCTNGICG